MIVLEADSFFWIVDHPPWEEDGAVEQFVTQVCYQAHVGTGWFCPGNFIDALPYANNISLLIFHPTVRHNPAVNTVIKGGFVFDINLVVPAIIIGIYKVFADEAA